MKPRSILSNSPCILLICAFIVIAKKGYVTDSFEITLRTNANNRAKVIAMPHSGTSLEIIKVSGNWTLVKMLEGKKRQGWVLSRYVITRSPWESIYTKVNEKYTNSREKVTTLAEECKILKTKVKELERSLKKSQKDGEISQNNYEKLKDNSTQYLALKNQYDGSLRELSKSHSSIEALKQENGFLKADDKKRWFTVGAIVIAIGFLCGLVFGQKKKKKRYSY